MSTRFLEKEIERLEALRNAAGLFATIANQSRDFANGEVAAFLPDLKRRELRRSRIRRKAAKKMLQLMVKQCDLIKSKCQSQIDWYDTVEEKPQNVVEGNVRVFNQVSHFLQT